MDENHNTFLTPLNTVQNYFGSASTFLAGPKHFDRIQKPKISIEKFFLSSRIFEPDPQKDKGQYTFYYPSEHCAMINSRGFLLPISSPQKSLPLKKSFPHLFFPEFLYFPKASASNWLEKKNCTSSRKLLKRDVFNVSM